MGIRLRLATLTGTSIMGGRRRDTCAREGISNIGGAETGAGTGLEAAAEADADLEEDLEADLEGDLAAGPRSVPWKRARCPGRGCGNRCEHWSGSGCGPGRGCRRTGAGALVQAQAHGSRRRTCKVQAQAHGGGGGGGAGGGGGTRGCRIVSDMIADDGERCSSELSPRAH